MTRLSARVNGIVPILVTVFDVRYFLVLLLSGALQAGIVKVVLVDHASGQPLAHTRITLQRVVSAGEPPQNVTLFSGKYGTATFADVPAGSYLLTARKRFYVDTRYGQKSWRHPGLPFTVGDQEFVAQIRMQRLGVITGEIVDENRIGIPGVPVIALRSGVRARVVAKGETDDRGAFRIAGLAPGRYVVQSGAASVDDRALIPTYYGQTPRLYDARFVDTQVESETPISVIEPILGRLFTLKVAVAAPGDAIATVSLYTDAGRRDVELPGGGIATYSDLPPGTYDILVRCNDHPPTASYQRIQLGRDDQVNVSLSPAPQWRIVCADKRGGPLDPKAGFHVLVRRKMPPDEEWMTVPCGVHYSTPGVWEISATAPQGWYFQSTSAFRSDESYDVDMVNGRPFMSTEVRFSNSPAEVKGIVKPRGEDPVAAIPVFLIPLDKDVRIRTGFKALETRADMEGRFSMTGVLPGRYAVIASWERAEIDIREWTPDGGEQTVTLAEGNKTEVEITIRQI